MKKKWLIPVILLLVIGLSVLGAIVGYRLWRGPVAETGNPRLDTDEAPPFVPGQVDPDDGRHEWDRYGWPYDFEIPLEIKIEVPEVPQTVRGPTPVQKEQ